MARTLYVLSLHRGTYEKEAKALGGYDSIHSHIKDKYGKRVINLSYSANQKDYAKYPDKQKVRDFRLPYEELELRSDNLQSALREAVKFCQMFNLRRVILFRNNYSPYSRDFCTSQTPIGEVLHDKNGWTFYKFNYSKGQNRISKVPQKNRIPIY